MLLVREWHAQALYKHSNALKSDSNSVNFINSKVYNHLFDNKNGGIEESAKTIFLSVLTNITASNC